MVYTQVTMSVRFWKEVSSMTPGPTDVYRMVPCLPESFWRVLASFWLSGSQPS